MPVVLHKATFAKAELAKLSDAEKRLFVIAGHIANEIAALQKILVCSMQHKPTSEVGRCAQSVQNLVLSKLLAGKLREAARAIERYYFSGLSRDYHDQLPLEAQEAERRLRDYFSRQNPITTVRNEAAFHYSGDDVPTAIEQLPNEHASVLWIGEESGNSLYFFAEEPLFADLLGRLPGSGDKAAFDTFISDEIRIARDVTTFFQGCMYVALTKLMPNRDLEREEVSRKDTGKLDHTAIPFFLER